LFSLLPQNGAAISSTELLRRFYPEYVPVNGRITMTAAMRYLRHKVEANREPFRIGRRRQDGGAQPIEWYITREKSQTANGPEPTSTSAPVGDPLMLTIRGKQGRTKRSLRLVLPAKYVKEHGLQMNDQVAWIERPDGAVVLQFIKATDIFKIIKEGATAQSN
jgi:hypothetical protein